MARGLSRRGCAPGSHRGVLSTNGMICHAFHPLCVFSTVDAGFGWVARELQQNSPASTDVSLQYMC